MDGRNRCRGRRLRDEPGGAAFDGCRCGGFRRIAGRDRIDGRFESFRVEQRRRRSVEFSSLPGLRFTVENGVVTRADAGPGVRNELGVQLGDTTESVLSLYPNLSMRKNRESAGGTDLILIDPDGGHAIVMQAAGNKIISIRAGLSASVGSVQGCP
jgi:uncharacterized protein (AIM24 family)